MWFNCAKRWNGNETQPSEFQIMRDIRDKGIKGDEGGWRGRAEYEIICGS